MCLYSNYNFLKKKLTLLRAGATKGKQTALNTRAAPPVILARKRPTFDRSDLFDDDLLSKASRSAGSHPQSGLLEEEGSILITKSGETLQNSSRVHAFLPRLQSATAT